MWSLVSLALSLPIQSVPLQRPCAIGLVGDHDGDGVVDYAVIGQRDPIQVSIRSGSNDVERTRFETPASPACRFSMHAQHVRVLADLDGDGVAELAAHDGRAWLLEGRTGAVLRELGDGSMFLAALGDLDHDGVMELAISDTKALPGLHWHPTEVARVWSGRTLADLSGNTWRNDEMVARIAAASSAGACVVRSASVSSPWIVRRELLDRSSADSEAESPRIVVSNASDGATLWERSFEFEIVDPEHGGYGDLRCGVLPDLDGDGEPELVLAQAADAMSHLGKRSFLGAIGLRQGRDLWRCAELEVEGLHPGVDVLPDRDGDGVPEVLVSIAGDSESAMAILSGRTGAVLRRFVP